MYYQRRHNSFGDDILVFFRKKSVLPRLILINLAVFLIIYIINLVFWLFKIDQTGPEGSIAQLFAVPSDPARLLTRPWTVFTYMFLHLGLLHLLFNMWMLYFGGMLFLRYLSDRQLMATYIFGGLAGAVVYIFAYNAFPVFSEANPHAIALGASASVLAILVAIASWVPNYPVNLFLIGTVRIKYVALALIIIDFLSIQGSNPGGHLAHLGGALWGFVYAGLMRKGYDPSLVFSLPKPLRRKASFEVFPGERKQRPETDEEYNRRKVSEQRQIDAILDKIAQSGYDSLSSREKEILFRNSNKKN